MNENERLRIKAQKHLEQAEMYLGFGKPFWKSATANDKIEGIHRRMEKNTDHRYRNKVLGGFREKMRNRSIASETNDALRAVSDQASKALTHMLLGRWAQTTTSTNRATVRKACDAILKKEQWAEMEMDPADFDDLQNRCLRSGVKGKEFETIALATKIVNEVLVAFQSTSQYIDWENAMNLASRQPNEVYALMLRERNVAHIAKYLATPNIDERALGRLLADYLFKNKADPE